MHKTCLINIKDELWRNYIFCRFYVFIKLYHILTKCYILSTTGKNIYFAQNTHSINKAIRTELNNYVKYFSKCLFKI